MAVTDHGPGMPPEFRQRIFEKFAQADSSSTREKGGTGLGLSISRAIVERHQGRIGFTSEPGVATTFFFDLPLFDPPDWRRPRPRATASRRRAERPLILICEDDRDVARLLSLMLEREGYRARRGARRGGGPAAPRRALLRRADPRPRAAGPGRGLADPRAAGRRGDEPAADRRRLGPRRGGARGAERRRPGGGRLAGQADRRGAPDGRRCSRRSGAPLGAGARILHVEDDPDLQRVVAAIVDQRRHGRAGARPGRRRGSGWRGSASTW